MSDRRYCTSEKGCSVHPPKSGKDLGHPVYVPMDYSWAYQDPVQRAAVKARREETAEVFRRLHEEKQERPDPECIILGEIATGVRSCGTCFHHLAATPFNPGACRRFPVETIKAAVDYCFEWKARP